MDFWNLINNGEIQPSEEDPCRFVIVSGNFPKSGVALPLGNRRMRAAALREFYLYKGKTFWSKTKINILRIFNFSFVWKMLFRRQFVVNFNPGKENIFSFLNRRLSLVSGYESNVACSIYVGSRKFIMPIFDQKRGNLLGVAKIYFPETVDYGENETEVLKFLKGVNLSEFNFPKVLTKDHFKGSLVVVLSSSPSLKKTSLITNHHLDFLKELSEKTGARERFLNSNFYKEIGEEVAFLKTKLRGKFGLLEDLFGRAIDRLKDGTFIFSLAKREFPYFEMMRFGGGFFVIDWELARFGFPPIFDFYSLALSGTSARGVDFVEVYERKIEKTFFSNDKKTMGFARHLFPHWGMSGSVTYWFFVLFLFDQLYIHLKSGDELSRTRVLPLLEKICRNEKKFRRRWFDGKELFK